MGIIKFLFVLVTMAAGFFAGGTLTDDIRGAIIGLGLGFIVALIAINFWRVLYKLAIFAAIIIGVATFFGCDSNPTPRTVNNPVVTADPSSEDIIQAVRRSVAGKTYTISTVQEEQRVHRCSQIDVELDPYMPRNPELAKCPRVGATYPTWETVTKREERTCDSLPGPEHGWHVESVGSDRWRVAQAGSVWDVEKLDGASASVDKYVKVSNFTFAINAHQDC